MVGVDRSHPTRLHNLAHEQVNLWIGDGRAVSSFHRDPYENTYAVLVGEKVGTGRTMGIGDRFIYCCRGICIPG